MQIINPEANGKDQEMSQSDGMKRVHWDVRILDFLDEDSIPGLLDVHGGQANLFWRPQDSKHLLHDRLDPGPIGAWLPVIDPIPNEEFEDPKACRWVGVSVGPMSYPNPSSRGYAPGNRPGQGPPEEPCGMEPLDRRSGGSSVPGDVVFEDRSKS